MERRERYSVVEPAREKQSHIGQALNQWYQAHDISLEPTSGEDPMTYSRILFVVALLTFAEGAGSAQSMRPAPPRDADVCELTKDPPAWNTLRVRITGTATYDFENFSLADSSCHGRKQAAEVWLTYGGRLTSGTTYCCPGEGGNSTRSTPLTIDGVTPPPVTEDKTLNEFRELLTKRLRTRARVTLVGTFFAGTRTEMSATGWGGYGHLGCCSLFVIERVERFEVAEDL